MEKRITTYRNRNNPVTAMQGLVNYKKVCSFLGVRFVSLQASLEAERKKGFFKQNRWRFSRKAKGLIVFAIITVMLISIFAFLPKLNNSTPNNPTASPSDTSQGTNNQTSSSNALSALVQAISNVVGSAAQAFSPPKAPGVIASAQTINSTVWRAVAANAWQYFQPGVGVDSTTGLPLTYFTDWDLGVYIQAVIDAQNLNLTTTDGAWGSYARLDKVLTWLETRELNNASYPYWFYQATDGEDYHADSDKATAPVDVVDTGRLFVALNNLRVFNSSLASRINNIVLYGQNNGRSNYTALVPGIKSDILVSTSIYSYYFDSGFASFWPNDLPNASTILNNILNAGNVTTPQGVLLPKASILGDPLLCSVFELNNNDSRLMALANQVYLAHEAYYNATGRQYRAFSEGSSLTTQWVYEWVVLPDGRTWVVLNENGSDFNMTPVIYTKVAMGFLAIYNTTFARNMVVYLENALPTPANGYSEGVDESGTLLTMAGDLTNGLIIGAARYAIQNNP
jgi:hypothetical protein